MCSVQKVFWKIPENSQESTCARVSFLEKLQVEVCNFIKKETLPQLFYCDFWEIFKNIFCHRTLPVAACVFLYLLKTSEYLCFFWHFQGVYKLKILLKCVFVPMLRFTSLIFIILLYLQIKNNVVVKQVNPLSTNVPLFRSFFLLFAFGSLLFSGGIRVEHRLKIGHARLLGKLYS